MKILRLGTSQDAVDVPPEQTLEYLIHKGLEAELGEPVEMVTKRAWPTPKLPLLVREWMTEVEPDVVVIPVVPYWFMYQSVPLKQQRLGRLGKFLGDTGQQAADIKWLAHNAVFRAGRSVATRIIGGASPFTPDEVLESIIGCIREIIRHEGVIVFVDGPPGYARFSRSARTLKRLEEDRLYVNSRLAEVCAKYHVVFKKYETPVWLSEKEFDRSGDGLHMSAAGNAPFAAVRVQLYVDAIREGRRMGAAEER